MTKKLTIILAVVTVLALAVGVSAIIVRARSIRSFAPCINRLRQFEGAKEQWALEQNKTTNDTPTWSDLYPYIYLPYFTNRWFTNGVPVCPDGGTYTLGRVGVPPTCSLADKEPNHKLPDKLP